MRVMNVYQHPRRFRKALLLVVASAVPLLSAQVASAQMKFSDLFGPGPAQPEQGSASSAFSRASSGIGATQQSRDPEYYVRLAMECHARQDYVQEKNNMNAAISLDPTRPEYFEQRAASYARLKEFSPAIADISRALQLDPNSAEFYCRRALYRGEMSQWENSLADAYKAGQLDPNNRKYMLLPALIFARKGDYPSEIDACTVCINRDPNFGEAYAVRGSAKLALGDTVSGNADRSKARSLGYQTHE